MNHARTIAIAAALLATGAVFGATPPEGSYPEQPTISAGQGLSRAEVAAEAARYNLAGKPGEVRGESRPEFVQDFGQRRLTRAEVIADLQLWNRAGLSAAGHGEASPDVHGSDYQSRLAAYQSLRDGPAYAEAIRQLVAGSTAASSGG
jgi:hypothetical protein